MMRLLLLEDDQVLSETLQLFLTREEYHVDGALTIEEAEDLCYKNKYDVYLFDINLPDGSGLELLKNLRYAEDNTPTIFITALTDMHSMSQGFELDAIDYIKKPFNPEELLMRLKAKFKNNTFHLGGIVYDKDSQTLYKDGELMDIGNVQYKIFIKLLENTGAVVTVDELYECLEHPSNTALRVAITKIKQRLKIDIKNIRGKGYIIEKI